MKEIDNQIIIRNEHFQKEQSLPNRQMTETIKTVENLLRALPNQEEKTTSTSDVKKAAQLLADDEALLMFYSSQRTEATYAYVGQTVMNAANAACPGVARAANAALAMAVGRLPLTDRQVEVHDARGINQLSIHDLMNLRKRSAPG